MSFASSSASGVAGGVLPGHQITEKLTKTNHVLWKAQVLPTLRGAELTGFLDGTEIAPPKTISVKKGDKGEVIQEEPNPEYSKWLARDQHVLGYLLSSLSREILTHVASKTTASQVWKAIEDMFASQTRARSINTRLALATTQKGTMTIPEYFGKMHSYADEMVVAGKPLDDEELIAYILNGLDIDYNPVVSNVLGRSEPITVSELYSQLLTFENRMDLLQGGMNSQSSVNSASRGRGGRNGRGGNRGRGYGRSNRGHGSRGGYTGRGSANTDTRPRCQLCDRPNHTVVDCWYRFDENFVPEKKTVAAATNSYGVDTNWYTDTGATDHITCELDKLNVHNKYNGTDQIHTASGAGNEESTSSRKM